ncbi:MAG: HD domain-containing protein [Dehalococcoidia bacterium]
MFGKRAGYRTLQFGRALFERQNCELEALARAYLDGPGLALFHSLTPRDQRHSAQTASHLLRAGCVDGELLVAALLHDVGKGDQRLWQRVAYVLLAAGSAPLLAWTASSRTGWRGAFWRSLHHPDLGSEAAGQAGYSERVAQLIAQHHCSSNDPDLVALQSADERA